MAKKKILVVDDELAITKVVAYYLKREGFNVEIVTYGYAALNAIKIMHFDLIILDLMLPDINGLDIAKQLKSNAETANIPIVMLTAKVEEDDILTGFKLNADDYVTKPFSPAILTARIKALLRQLESYPEHMQNNLYLFACGLIIVPESDEVYVNNIKIELNQTEYELLLALARNNGQAMSRGQLTACIQNHNNCSITKRGLDFPIMTLRKKMGSCGKCIHTLKGYGYKFMDQLP